MKLGELVFVINKSNPELACTGLIVKIYDSGGFYIKSLCGRLSNDPNEIKKWRRYGDCDGYYIKKDSTKYVYTFLDLNSPYLPYVVRQTCYSISTTSNIMKNVFENEYRKDYKEGTISKYQSILVFQISFKETVYGPTVIPFEPCTYVLIDGKFGDFAPGVTDNSMRIALTKARVNKLENSLL